LDDALEQRDRVLIALAVLIGAHARVAGEAVAREVDGPLDQLLGHALERQRVDRADVEVDFLRGAVERDIHGRGVGRVGPRASARISATGSSA